MTERAVYHGTPLTPLRAFPALDGRLFCVPFNRPDSLPQVLQRAAGVMFDNGEYARYSAARRAGDTSAPEDPKHAAEFEAWKQGRLATARLQAESGSS